MTNLLSTNNSNFTKSNFDNTQKMNPNSNYFKGRFISRTRN